MKSILLVTLTALSLAGAVQADGDPSAGKGKAMMCGACHGADGNSAVPSFPKLAGQ
ncbi:MAG: cytochrome c553, partial [Chitinophagales bacterium]